MCFKPLDTTFISFNINVRRSLLRSGDVLWPNKPRFQTWLTTVVDGHDTSGNLVVVIGENDVCRLNLLDFADAVPDLPLFFLKCLRLFPDFCDLSGKSFQFFRAKFFKQIRVFEMHRVTLRKQIFDDRPACRPIRLNAEEFRQFR